MNQQGAAALVKRIEREPGWRAETSYNARSGAWTVKAWDAESGRRGAPDATFTTPYDWYYCKASLASAMRQLKALRRCGRVLDQTKRKAV
ncbi:MAG TPA: hypothetical protein VGF38_01510 [Ktedonobacterales bacterium]|jgi:hypothetical protein